MTKLMDIINFEMANDKSTAMLHIGNADASEGDFWSNDGDATLRHHVKPLNGPFKLPRLFFGRSFPKVSATANAFGTSADATVFCIAYDLANPDREK